MGLSLLVVAAFACDDGSGGGGDGDGDGDVGSSCVTADDCFTGVSDVSGAIECLDRTADGYCTHECTTDDDCCAADGECPNGKRQVCAPFESTGKNLCFVSCEDADLDGEDADAYCEDFADLGFGCRSTGGGSNNRKVCFPN